MERNQKMECAQELSNTSREQVGYLGTYEQKHPLFIGHNKIGRDPGTCSIILNSNFISKHHALINIINSKELMVMDLDSVGKTKLSNKKLRPYIPYRLKDGDVVQFGNIYGVVNLLEEDDAQPIMQNINVPGIPIIANNVSNLNRSPTALIYDIESESLDVSERGDSFITPSTSTRRKCTKKLPKTRKTLPVQTWIPNAVIHNTSSSSSSFAGNPNTSLNETFIPRKIGSDSFSFINCEDETQVYTDNLPQIRKINDQHEMQIDIYAANKDNKNNIFNAETEAFGIVDDSIENVNKKKSNVTDTSEGSNEGYKRDKLRVNSSKEELLSDDIESKKQETKAAVERKTLMIPERASSFSIHPGLCKDQCSYCGIKFRLFDKPCHIAQIKNSERQKKVLDNEKMLTVDSCLCEACYRFVIRRTNYLSYRKPPLSKHPITLTRKFPKKCKIKIRQQPKNKKLKIKLGPKSKKGVSTEPEKMDIESSEKPNNSTLEEIILIESSEDEKQPNLDQNKTLVVNTVSSGSDPNYQSKSSEADMQTELLNKLKQQNDPSQIVRGPPQLNTLKKLREVKRSIQHPDSLHKTPESCIRKVNFEQELPQTNSLSKDFEEDIVKINILKKLPLNEEWTIEPIANKKPADIILLRSKSAVKNNKNMENNKNTLKEHLTILKKISMNTECTLEIIPKNMLPDMNMSTNKTQMSKNTTQVNKNVNELSEDIRHTKESNPMKRDNNDNSNTVIEALPSVDNIPPIEESTINTTPRMKPDDINVSKGKWLVKKNLSGMLKDEDSSKVELSNKWGKGKHSIPSEDKEDRTKEDTPVVDTEGNISPNEKCVKPRKPNEKPYKVIISKNKWRAKRNLNVLKKKQLSKVKLAMGKHSIPINSDHTEKAVKEDIPIANNFSMDKESTSNTIPNKTPPNTNISKNKGQVKKSTEQNKLYSQTYPSIFIRKMLPGEGDMNLHCNIEFDNVKEVTSQGWEKCDSTIQFDKETKKVWDELQRPYGNRSSFLRHLVQLEKYFRQGDLILSQRNASRGSTQ